jgi:hypothetical protein
MRTGPSNHFPEQPGNDRTKQGRQRNQQIELLHLCHRNASLSLETIQVINMNCPQITEQCNEYRQTDCRLGRRNCQDEKYKNLACSIPQDNKKTLQSSD